jgi:fucose permease
LFLGSLVAQIAAGPITDKVGQRVVLIVSLLIVAIGITGFTTAKSLPLMLGLVFLTGLGQGGVDLGANLVVSDAYPKNNTSVLNLLHFFFGLGAFFGPALVSLVLTLAGSGLIVHWSAAGLFVLLAVAAILLRGSDHKKTINQSVMPAGTEKTKSVYATPLVWLVGSLLLVYVGVEYGMGSWATTFMNVTTKMPIASGALVTSAYWGFLTIGRLVGAIASRKLTRVQLLGSSLALALLGGIAFALLTGTTSPAIIATIVIGFSFGTVYPTSIAVLTAAYPDQQGKAVGAATAMGSIGGLALPWIAGVLLEGPGPLFYSWFIAAGIAISLAIFLAVRGRPVKKV